MGANCNSINLSNQKIMSCSFFAWHFGPKFDEDAVGKPIMESMIWLRRIDPNEFWENPTNA